MADLTYIYARDSERFSGGAESYVHTHCLASAGLGYSPEWFALGQRDEIEDLGEWTIRRVRSPGREYRGEYVNLYRRLLSRAVVDRLAGRRERQLLHSFGMWADVGAAAARELRRRGVDVVHVASCFELIGPHTQAKLDNQVLRGRPLAYARQRVTYEWVRRVTVPMERRAMREADAVIVNYRRLERLIHRDYDPRINVVRLPYATPAAFEPVAGEYGLPRPVAELSAGDGPLVVSTSRQMARKGVDVLIRALARLNDDGVPFRAALVGTGGLLESHRRLVAELGLAERVVLPGRVPDVRPYLRHADVFALPSLAEGSGSMSVLEALQFGVAVVSSAVDGMVEDLTEGEDALLVETGSVEDLYRGLKSLTTDAALRGRLGAAGRELYARRFSADAASRALGEFYAGLGCEPSPSSSPAPAPAA